jgi:hypothetical protein
MERLAKDGMERIFGNPFQDAEQNELLRYLKQDLYEHQALIDRVFIHFVFKGSIEAAENSAGLRDRRENLENKKYLIDHYFGNRHVELVIEYISDERRTPPPPPRDSHTVSYTEAVSIKTADGAKTLHIGFIPLMDLYRIYRSVGQKFFDRNIRAGLSPENPPNRKIREALADIVLKQRQSAETFVFNHNGVTLAAERIVFEDGQATVQVPRLLNGAQTVTSISKFLEDNEGHPALNSNQKALEEVRVVAKIVEYDPWSEFVTTVTICNNQQNPVDPWNLRANDRIQCDLEDKFKEEVGIFYSRQENAFGNLSELERQEMGIEDSRDIKIRPLAQTFLAVQGEIDKMSRLPEVFENQKIYEDTFRESYLRADARKIVLAYKVHLVLNSPLKRLEERAPKKLEYALSRARNLVWALLIQGVLNDVNLLGLLERYGNTLAKETDLREYLKNLASARILPIMKEVLADESYQEKMDAEKYSFLRTKEIFNRCRDVAFDKYSWTKKSL